MIFLGLNHADKYLMPLFSSLEPAIDPGARPTFLLDWEVTLKCNLDCSYCGTPQTMPLTWATHDNSSEHPDLNSCLQTIDFMFAYADLYMQHKPRWNRAVVLNVYGGESLIHPDIEEIFRQIQIKYQTYKDQWPLKVTCTTNGVVGKKRMRNICKFVDEFTVTYHVESLAKQKKQMLDNLLLIKQQEKDLKCVILMHGNHDFWPELHEVIDFCKRHNIRHLPRNLDGPVNSTYNTHQIKWFKNLWQERSPKKSQQTQLDTLEHQQQKLSSKVSLVDVGRACCGGRLLCTDQNLKQPIFFAPDNNFRGWQCSVNWYFLFVKQYTREIFVNKDCRMNFDQGVGPIADLDHTHQLLQRTKALLDSDQMPVITCAKTLCECGLCAPKAKTRSTFLEIMKKQVKDIGVFGHQ